MSETIRLERLERQDFSQVWNIMEHSFPPEERRTRTGQEGLLDNPHYQFYGYKKEGIVTAFFAVWQFDEFLFVEHFAVSEDYRNSGIGAELLQQLLQMMHLPTVLEVELPEGELPCRRIRFYERNGFVLNDYDYIQPSMQEGKPEIPLRIMSYPNGLAQKQFEAARDTLYREVYHVR